MEGIKEYKVEYEDGLCALLLSILSGMTPEEAFEKLGVKDAYGQQIRKKSRKKRRFKKNAKRKTQSKCK